MIHAQTEIACVVQRSSGRMRLRTLLADSRWHSAAELEHVAGRRYGARLYELRKGSDKMPAIYVQARPKAGTVGDGVWEYRRVPAAECEGRRCDDGPCDPLCQIGGAV
jgi:hypothetical protein